MTLCTIETPTHGRFLHEARDPRRLLVGFHGYGENAELHMAELQQIPGAESWSLVAVQALHPFYTRSEQVVANWMTRQDRELAIADNIEYVRRVLATLPSPRTLVFLGFSQGAAMASRAAARVASAQGLILLGGDIPPELRSDDAIRWPATLLARGVRDDWYTDAKLESDAAFLEPRTRVTRCIFDGGHEWTSEFRASAGEFLRTVDR
ncbi:MAG: phospholipase [Acidobacteria bacterium]|nr:phospholipase [Acidobacteriota bacterium]MBV9474537.1 phospholipase [Acidobacteriota bacterium]